MPTNINHMSAYVATHNYTVNGNCTMMFVGEGYLKFR